MAKSDNSTAAALHLQELVRERGSFGHVAVRPRAGHLNVEVTHGDGAREIVARATPVGAGLYGLSFRNHSGRWEPIPVMGNLAEVATGITDLLGPFLTL